MDDIIKNGIEKICDLQEKEKQYFELNGKHYKKSGYSVIEPPEIPGINTSTLDGLAEYVNKFGVEEETKDRFVISVIDQQNVAFLSPINFEYGKRDILANASISYGLPTLHDWREQEDFIIFLNSNFVDTDDKEKILKYSSSVMTESTEKKQDNGLSQTVVVKKGHQPMMEVVPNPVKLAPYRTFREVEQPGSTFIFRIKDDQFRIFEADGKQWRLDAIISIKNYIKEKLEIDIPVIG